MLHVNVNVNVNVTQMVICITFAVLSVVGYAYTALRTGTPTRAEVRLTDPLMSW